MKTNQKLTLREKVGIYWKVSSAWNRPDNLPKGHPVVTVSDAFKQLRQITYTGTCNQRVHNLAMRLTEDIVRRQKGVGGFAETEIEGDVVRTYLYGVPAADKKE